MTQRHTRIHAPLRALAVVILLAGLVFGDAGAGLAKSDKAKGHGNKSNAQTTEERVEDEVIDEVLDGIFGENDREIIQRYVKDHGIKSKGLPPGIAKNLERGKPLPPGIAKRFLPSDLEGRLPKLRDGLERIIVGDDVTIIEEGTRIVVDILRDVLKRQ
ncbi:MAG: anti-virulence regulator CigR family protein [Alphaproteobacteria bacterium]